MITVRCTKCGKPVYLDVDKGDWTGTVGDFQKLGWKVRGHNDFLCPGCQ